MPDPRFKYSNTQPFEFDYGDLHFYSVETFYQAMKTTDAAERRKISQMPWQEAKDYASSPNLPGWRGQSEWDRIKLDVMEWALRKKFAPGSPRAHALALDKSELVEYNTWHDNIWGDCTCKRKSCQPTGTNYLGKLLTKIREELRTQNVN